MIVYSLSSQAWQLKGFWPWVPLLGKSMETSADLLGVTDWIPATVPGGVHYDLYRKQLIPHPYQDLNSLQCEWVENRWWIYRTTISRPERTGRKVELYFKGLDYEVDVYVNNRLMGAHRGMYHPLAIDVTALFAEHEHLELRLLFRGVPDEMGQIGKTSQTFTQKSRFGYKWDFSTRLVNIGVWDEIQLRVHESWSFDELSVRTDLSDGVGIIDVDVDLTAHVEDAADQGPALELNLVDPAGREVACERVMSPGLKSPSTLSTRMCVTDPLLWFPNGYGEQPLYRLRLRLVAEAQILDERILDVGIRSLGYAVNEGGPRDALPYTFLVNGVRIHIQGVNLTPLDHLYGNVTSAHYEWVVRCMVEAGANLVRVWGGGLIERDEFYTLCDRHGILIWQEFIQSSSGVDNTPSKRPEFIALLRETAIEALISRRNHTSLAVWSGGNELMSAPNVPSKLSDPNLAMLRDLVERHDPLRLFLPTSASGPVEYMTTQRDVMHDVHGHWKYQGPAEHYSLYGESDSLFHSEFGVDGCSDARSLCKFLSSRSQVPASVADNLVWRHHGEWWDTLARDRGFFGNLEDLSLFSDCSQWIQAEGLRFILEANRRHQPRNSGSIIWQLNEPWPNTSCTSLIDYFGEKKMAYYWTRTAFAARHASLDYRQLSHPVGSTFKATLHFHNRGPACTARIRAEVVGVNGRSFLCVERLVSAPANGNGSGGDLEFIVTPDLGEMFFVRLSVLGEAAAPHENLYIFSTRNETLYAPAIGLRHSKLSVEALGEWQVDNAGEYKRSFRVANAGEQVALFIRPEEIGNAWWIEASHAYLSLFPGEQREIHLCCLRKRAGGFLTEDQPNPDGAPKIGFRAWGERLA